MPNTLHGQNPRTIRTPEKRTTFLEAVENTCNITQSCARAGISRRAAYEWREEDREFREAWDRAVAMGADVLEDEAVRRAKDGVDRPVYQGGEMVGTIREYSDTLLIFLLKGAKPYRYKERSRVEHSGRMTLEQLVCGSDDDDSTS